jgi:hypothetical protein
LEQLRAPEPVGHQDRLILLGDDGLGHRPWNCSTAEATERLIREWLTEWGEKSAAPGSMMWLDNTPAGDAVGCAVLACEDENP